MFLSPSTLNRMMKQAYKSGLTVARTEEDWLHIAGNYWEADIKKEFIPKRTLGDLIALVGELPQPGERFKATKEGNQMEIEMPLEINTEPFKGCSTLTETDVLLIGTAGTIQRLLQDEDTGNIYVINNVFSVLVNNGVVMEDKGEYRVGDPLFNPAYGLLWKNNVCELRTHFRSDDKNNKILESLKGVDITPEVPE